MSLSSRTPFHESGWVKVQTPLGPSIAPHVEIGLKGTDGQWQQFDMKIDSGAAITFLNEEDKEILGFKEEDGEECEWKAVNNTPVPSRVLTLDLRIGQRYIGKARVAFSTDKKRDGDRLFGVLDVYNTLHIALRARVSKNFFAFD